MLFLAEVIPAVLRILPVSDIKEWAAYGTEPGVLVGIIVVGCAIIVTGVLRYARWFIMWHTEQMEAQRQAHSVERDRLLARLLEYVNEE